MMCFATGVVVGLIALPVLILVVSLNIIFFREAFLNTSFVRKRRRK